MLKTRRRGEPPINLLLMGILLFTAGGIVGPFRTPDLTAGMVGILVYTMTTAYRYAVPKGTGGRVAYAMVRACALWLIVGAAIYLSLAEAAVQDDVTPIFERINASLPERFWFPLCWIVLTVICFLFGPKGHDHVRQS